MNIEEEGFYWGFLGFAGVAIAMNADIAIGSIKGLVGIYKEKLCRMIRCEVRDELNWQDGLKNAKKHKPKPSVNTEVNTEATSGTSKVDIQVETCCK